MKTTDETPAGSPIFRKMLAEQYADRTILETLKRAWLPTPWMVNVRNSGRYDRLVIRNWCNHNLGSESVRHLEIDGNWREGNVTMNGLTWYGFKTEELMKRFQAWQSTWEQPSHLPLPVEK